MTQTLKSSALKIYKDEHCTVNTIRDKRIAIIGYGSQGHAHALNLRDSGIRDIVIGLRDGSENLRAAKGARFDVDSPEVAVNGADIVMLLTPDETHAEFYEHVLADGMKQDAALGFAHGLSIYFETIKPRRDLDVFMVAPKGPGVSLRSEYLLERGLPCLMAVSQDASGQTHNIALSYAAAIGCGRSGIIETTFKDECETDLFGEQAVLCGGIPALIQAGYETLVEAGYPPEMAYFECIHEAKLITDLIYERGIADMYKAVSNTAEYGGYSRGGRVITADTKAEMKKILTEIQSGDFVREYMGPKQDGLATLPDHREDKAANAVEAAGRAVRALLPWLGSKPNKSRRSSRGSSRKGRTSLGAGRASNRARHEGPPVRRGGR